MTKKMWGKNEGVNKMWRKKCEYKKCDGIRNVTVKKNVSVKLWENKNCEERKLSKKGEIKKYEDKKCYIKKYGSKKCENKECEN